MCLGCAGIVCRVWMYVHINSGYSSQYTQLLWLTDLLERCFCGMLVAGNHGTFRKWLLVFPRAAAKQGPGTPRVRLRNPRAYLVPRRAAAPFPAHTPISIVLLDVLVSVHHVCSSCSSSAHCFFVSRARCTFSDARCRSRCCRGARCAYRVSGVLCVCEETRRGCL